MPGIPQERRDKKMVVETRYGKIQGVTGEHAWIYKGVPYAKPPVGDLRWRAPEKPDAWEGVLNADTFPPMAIQGPQEEGSFYHKEFYNVPEFMPGQSEDCLYLNLWIPKQKDEKPYPVAIWYHGGAFISGFSSELEFDGEAYARRGVILVTVGYRLGLMGFFAHPVLRQRDGHSGNYGTLDQIAALDWVRENIGDFGGDPNLITIMGQSAGAMSVRTLCASPLSRGKIQRAIIQSGGGYRSPLAMANVEMEKMEKGSAAALDEMGMTLEALYEKTPQELMTLQGSIWKGMAEATGCMLPLCPQLDGYSLTKSCDQILEDGEQPNIPYLIGSNLNDLAQEDTGDGVGLMQKSNTAFCAIQKENPHTYAYFFRRKLPGDEAGAFHSAELWYMFGTWKRCWRSLTEADGHLSEEMLDAWTAFIRTGNPGWEAYSEEHPVVKEFDVTHD